MKNHEIFRLDLFRSQSPLPLHTPAVSHRISVLIFILTSYVKNVTYFKSIFQLFYYYDICQFCSILFEIKGSPVDLAIVTVTQFL